jgi:hypothetical protein
MQSRRNDTAPSKDLTKRCGARTLDGKGKRITRKTRKTFGMKLFIVMHHPRLDHAEDTVLNSLAFTRERANA